MIYSLKPAQVMKTIAPSVGIFLICFALLMSPIPAMYPEVYSGITVDLCLLSPLLILGIGRYRKTTPFLTLPFLVLGFVLCYFLIPPEHKNVLDVLQTAVLPLVEFGILSFVGYKAIHFARALKKSGVKQNEGFSAIREVLQNSGFPSALTGFLTTELSIFYYAIWAWKPRERCGAEFSMYRESAQIPVCIGLMMVLGIETVVLHNLLTPDYPLIAWGLTILSVYSAFYFLAHLKALWLRPTIITSEGVWFKNGLLGESKVAFTAIDKIERANVVSADLMDATGGLGLKNPPDTINILIHFSSPQMICKPYGQKKPYPVLGICIDRPAEFEKMVQQNLG